MTDHPPRRTHAIPASESDEAARFPHWRRNMIVLFLANTLLTAGFAVSYPFLPLVLREMGFRGNLETWVGYAVGSFFLLSFFFTPVWGAFADHFGRKPMVLRAGFGMGLIALGMGFAPEPWMFMVLFVAMGCTNGFIPASLALVATNTPVRFMGKALSLLQSGALLGNSLGPALGGILAGIVPTYQYLFAVSGGLILAAALLALVFAREIKQPPEGPFRLQVIRTLGRLSRIPGMPGLYGLNFLFSLSFFGSGAVISVFTLELLGDMESSPFKPSFMGAEPFWVGVVAMAMAISSAIALPFWGRLLDRFERKRILALGLLAAALSSILAVLAWTPFQLALARLVFGLLACGIGPALVLIVKSMAPPGMDARALYYGTAFGMLGMGAGPLIGGFVGPLLGLRTFFALITLLLLSGFLAWAWVGLRDEPAPATRRR